MLYNDMSPMENHHISSAFLLLMEEQNNFMCNCSRPVRAFHYITFLTAANLKKVVLKL
jgi:hypothetical protein